VVTLCKRQSVAATEQKHNESDFLSEPQTCDLSQIQMAITCKNNKLSQQWQIQQIRQISTGQRSSMPRQKVKAVMRKDRRPPPLLSGKDVLSMGSVKQHKKRGAFSRKGESVAGISVKRRFSSTPQHNPKKLA